MKYINDSSAIHLAGKGRGFEPCVLYISEYRCLSGVGMECDGVIGMECDEVIEMECDVHDWSVTTPY